jgi:hypothetical protein
MVDFWNISLFLISIFFKCLLSLNAFSCYLCCFIGLPSVHFSYVKNIKPGMPLFLFNYSDRKMHGIFEAATPGQIAIDQFAWSRDGRTKTQYPAQVSSYNSQCSIFLAL